MQGKLTSREAWVRFAVTLYMETDLDSEQVADEADQLLIEYLKRFPDPKDSESAKVQETEEGTVMDFLSSNESEDVEKGYLE